MHERKLRKMHFPERMLVVAPHVRDEREEHCRDCDYFNKNLGTDDYGKCNAMERFVLGYLLNKDARCPIGKWNESWVGWKRSK
jgi:hypothetical protein